MQGHIRLTKLQWLAILTNLRLTYQTVGVKLNSRMEMVQQRKQLPQLGIASVGKNRITLLTIIDFFSFLLAISKLLGFTSVENNLAKSWGRLRQLNKQVKNTSNNTNVEPVVSDLHQSFGKGFNTLNVNVLLDGLEQQVKVESELRGN